MQSLSSGGGFCELEDFVRVFPVNLNIYSSLDHPPPRSVGKPKLTTECSGLVAPGGWAGARAGDGRTCQWLWSPHSLLAVQII